MSEAPLVAEAAADAGRRSELSLGIAAGAVAVTAWGSSGIIVRFLDMGALAIMAYRYLLYAVVMAVLLAARRTPVTWAGMRHSLWGGLSLGAVTGLFIVAVQRTTIANVTIMAALHVVVVSTASALFLGERMRRRDIALAVLAMGGVAVVAFGSTGDENWSLGGDLAAVGALGGWAFYFFATRRAQMQVPTQQYTVCVAIYVGVLSLPAAALAGQDLSWPAAEEWMWLAVLAFGMGILGHNAMNWSLQHVPLWLASTLSLLTPVVASALAWLVFEEALSGWQMLAMAVVVASLTMIVRAQARPQAGGRAAARPAKAAGDNPA
ncbi:MAG: DMT family transporter [bacterium]|nr:DMT family transporter [bacterium]MDE0668142.1 DMT family transporter [bacterium]